MLCTEFGARSRDGSAQGEAAAPVQIARMQRGPYFPTGWRTFLLAAVCALTLFGGAASVHAQESATPQTDAGSSTEPASSDDTDAAPSDAPAAESEAAQPEASDSTASDAASDESKTDEPEGEGAVTAAAFQTPPTPEVAGLESGSKSEVDHFIGSFTNVIALDVPKFHGLEPALRLVYDSGNRNGFVGIGWTLRGISKIERASVRRGSPAFDATDVYMLDEEELVACIGGVTSPSCTAGGTHATRVESYLKVRYDTPTNKWEVWSRDGTKQTYSPISTWATDPDPRRSTGYRWLLSSVTDTHNNTVQYAYWCDGAPDCYIDTISYNATTIKFYRWTRPDPITYGIGAGSGQINYRLGTITIKLGTLRVRAYAPSYGTDLGTSTGRSRLVGLREYGNDYTANSGGLVTGGTSLPPISFTYSDVGNSPSNQHWVDDDALDPEDWLAGDINGNGRTDLVKRGTASALRSTGTNFVKVGYALSGTWPSPSNVNTWSLADVDGDGKDEQVLLGTAADVYIYGASTLTHQNWAASQGSPNQVKWVKGDFNGDGKFEFARDALVTSGCTISMLISTGTAFNRVSWPVAASPCPTISGSIFTDNDHAAFIAGDFNGDGKTDLARGFYAGGGAPGLSLHMFLSTGSGFVYQLWNGGTTGALAARWAFGDVNGDGKTRRKVRDNACIYCTHRHSWHFEGGTSPVPAAPAV